MREATLDAQSSLYSPANPASNPDYVNTATVRTDAAPRLDTNFATLGETELTFTLTAPLDMRFHISFPDAGSLSARYEGGTGYSTSGAIKPTATLSFVGLGGDAIGAPSEHFPQLTGPGTTADQYLAQAGWSFAAGTDFWFESLSLTALIPAGYATDLSGGNPAKAFLTGAISTSYDATFGQFVYLEAIPNGAAPLPASWLLFGLGGLLLARRCRQAG